MALNVAVYMAFITTQVEKQINIVSLVCDIALKEKGNLDKEQPGTNNEWTRATSALASERSMLDCLITLQREQMQFYCRTNCCFIHG